MSLPEFEKPVNTSGIPQQPHSPKLNPINKPIQQLKRTGIRSKWTKKTPDPNTPGGLKLGALQEFADSKSRVSAIKNGDTDRGLKMIFDWTKSSQLQFNEFEDLLAEVFHKVYKNIK